MVTIEKIRDLIADSNSQNILDFYQKKKKRLHYLLRGFLKEKKDDPYHKFLLNTSLGRKRVWVYINSIEVAFSGNVDVFFSDQEIIGYLRALEGYNVYDVLGFTVAYKRALWKSIREYNSNPKNKVNYLDIDDITILHQVSDCSYYLLSRSFMETSKQIITRHSEQLKSLQHYAADVVSIFEEEKIWACATQGIYEIFNLHGTYLVVNGNEAIFPNLHNVHMIGLQVSKNLQKKLIQNIKQHNQIVAIDSHDNIVSIADAIKNDFYKILCKPINDKNDKPIGLLFIHDQNRSFLFSRFDLELLQQFTYFTGAVLTNCRIALELGYSQRELGELAGKLISIQEKERKKIAADVHDTITQTLTGIGFEAVLCQKWAKRDLSRLDFELERLSDYINEAIHESRQLIHFLRPPVLDEIGIIPALKDLMNSFMQEGDFNIRYSLPRDMSIGPDKGISLYRIIQESLQNIKKHSQAKNVSVSLRKNENGEVSLTVADDGKGFDVSRKKTSKSNHGLGLLIMRERAKDMGGIINIESKIGKGSMVSLTFTGGDIQHEDKYQGNGR